jgi:D-glycero-D-manno-heptose 1,7-bisphosphate phosphatase
MVQRIQAQAPKLVIFGRDGVLNQYRDDHVKDPAEWLPIAGALEAVARLNQAGWHAVVATNQAGIGRGMIDMASLNAVHAHMMKLLAAQGGRIDAVFFCPHTPQEQCECRKPQPGMMRQIAERWGVDLADVPMVGDSLRELQAARNAGCQPHLVRSGRAANLTETELASWRLEVPDMQVHEHLGAMVDAVLRTVTEGPPSMPGALTAS